jgi:hypothetical protein
MWHVAFVIWFLYISLSLAIKNMNFFVFYTREDGCLESLQFFLLMLSAAMCYYLALAFNRKKDRLTTLMFAIGMVVFIVIGMEEISWGQRILLFSTPDILTPINKQHEFNLHNIKGISNKKLHLIVGSYGMFSGLSYFLLMRYIRFKRPHFVLPLRADLAVIPVQYIVYFIPLFLYYFNYYNLIEWFPNKRGLFFQEVAEFLFTFGCYLTLFLHLQKQWREQ